MLHRNKELNKLRDRRRAINPIRQGTYNKETRKAYERKLRLKRFNLTSDDYINILSQQDNRCAICNICIDECSRDFNIDHNHVSGRFRGLLCILCNSGIGFFRDDTNILFSAISYLTRHSMEADIL